MFGIKVLWYMMINTSKRVVRQPISDFYTLFLIYSFYFWQLWLSLLRLA